MSLAETDPRCRVILAMTCESTGKISLPWKLWEEGLRPTDNTVLGDAEPVEPLHGSREDLKPVRSLAWEEARQPGASPHPHRT
jgi:hypothetical protein